MNEPTELQKRVLEEYKKVGNVYRAAKLTNVADDFALHSIAACLQYEREQKRKNQGCETCPWRNRSRPCTMPAGVCKMLKKGK